MFDLLSTIEIAVNRLIPLDAAAEKKLAALDNKSLSIKVSDTPLAATVLFSDKSIAIVENFDPSATVSIQGPLKKMITFVLFHSDNPVQQSIRIKGDQNLLIELESLLKQLDLDWEEPLSRYLGDMAANQLGRASRKLYHWVKSSARTLKQNTEDYLNDELSSTIRHEELNTFLTAVDHISADTERLTAQVSMLENTLGQRA